jgi:hypothetical protein
MYVFIHEYVFSKQKQNKKQIWVQIKVNWQQLLQQIM